MTKLRKLSMAVVLALMLAPSAFAGITDTMPDAPPPPPPPSVRATGITDTPPAVASSDSVASIALNLLQTVLSMF